MWGWLSVVIVAFLLPLAAPPATALTEGLTVTMTDTPDPVLNGTSVIYTITVTNTSTAATAMTTANDVVLEDVLADSSDSQVSGATPTKGSAITGINTTHGTCEIPVDPQLSDGPVFQSPRPLPNGQPLRSHFEIAKRATCNLGDLVAGAIATVQVVVQAQLNSAGPGAPRAELTNTATVRSATPTATADTIVERTTVVPASILWIDDVSVTEPNSGSTTANFTVTLENGPSSGNVTVNYATAGATATSGTDYTAASGTLTFTPLDKTKPVTVTVSGDTTAEADETFVVNLSSPSSNALISDDQGTGTIVNNDAAFSIDDVSVAEGNGALTTAATFNVSRTGDILGTATVRYGTANNTATAGSDYVSITANASTELTFLSGETTKQVSVTVNGDDTNEADETFLVNLSLPTGAGLVDSQGQGTIANDDRELTIRDIVVTEPASGTTVANFTVALSNYVGGGTISVNYATADDSATAGSDYVAISSTTLNFTGTGEQTVSVTVNGDTTMEGTELFFVNLSGASASSGGVTLGDGEGLDGQGAAEIKEDSPAVLNVGPKLGIDDVTLREFNSGKTTASFTVTLAAWPPPTANVTVNYATATGTGCSPSGTATSGTDFVAITSTTLTFLPGQTTQRISVFVVGDMEVPPAPAEPNETFCVNLSGATGPSGPTIADSQGQATIQNDD